MEAERLINEGIFFSPEGWTEPYPKRIYVVAEGVLYRATPTVPGRSYHGFPESREEYERLPRPLRNAILERADALSCKEQLLQWLKST